MSPYVAKDNMKVIQSTLQATDGVGRRVLDQCPALRVFKLAEAPDELRNDEAGCRVLSQNSGDEAFRDRRDQVSDWIQDLV
jgi:hypothetical protein